MNRNAIRNRDQNFIHKRFPFVLISMNEKMSHIFSCPQSQVTSSFLIKINNQRTESDADQHLYKYSSIVLLKNQKHEETKGVGVYLTLHLE